MINPVELLKLNYYELERISPELIEQAKAQLLAQAGGEGITYQGKTLSSKEAEALADQLKSPQQLGLFIIGSINTLGRLLEGDASAEIEAEALNLEGFSEQLLPPLSEAYTQALVWALESGREEEALRLGRQLAQGSPAFQAQVFKPAVDLMANKRAELDNLAQQLQENYSEEAVRPLRGMQQLRMAYPIAVFNALPDHFSAAREELARTMGKIVHAVWGKDAALALAIARYARQLHMSEPYAQKLDQAIAHIQKKTAKAQKTAAAQKSRVWLAGIGLALLLIALLGLGLGLRQGYDLLTGFFYEPALGADLKELEEAGIDQDEIARLQEILAKKGSLSREDLEEIMKQGGSQTQIVEYDVLQLPWPERGKAAGQTLSGEVKLGSAPLAACFPPKAPTGKQNQQLTILGDAHYDALVFFFNGRDYIQQAFLPAQSQYVLQGKMDERQVISTMIVFGKNWDPKASSPCGTPGYFTQNIHYAGFAGYAIDPVYPDLRSDLTATLKKNRLLPARELSAQDFFDLLEKYR